MADNIQATPRNYIGGLLTDAYKWMQSPQRTQQLQGFAGLLGTTGIPQTIERMAYGEPLTNIGRANVPLLKPETADALMTVGPMVGPAARGAGRLVGSAINDAMVYGRGPLAAITPQPMRMVEDTGGLLSYRGSHTAPSPEYGAPLHDLTGGGQMYPADVYSPKAVQYYGTGNPKADREAFALANKVRGNPDAEVTMYRAVPKDESISNINAGDLVTLSKDYAKTHGESVLRGDYKILSQKVKAKDLWTNADSIQEFGYQPQGFAYPQEEALKLAQQRAALPVEKGGLGLPANNTAADRAAAMKYNREMFHETEGKNIEGGLLNFDVKRVGAAASDEQTPYAMFLKPHGERIGIAKEQPSQMPVLVKSDLTDENILRTFGNREELQSYLNQFPEIKEATQAVRDLDRQMANYIDDINKKADVLYAEGKTAEADKLLDSTNFNSNLMKEFDARTNELAALSKQKITDLFKSQGVGTIGLTNDAGAFGRKTLTEMVLDPSENVRSRFAAFDPFRRNAAIAAAMGVAAPNLLAEEVPTQRGLLAP